MTARCGGCIALSALFFLAFAAGTAADWVEFADETSTRLVAPAGLGVEDEREKDYAWGDVDRDGDIDLVVVRKEPFTSPGKDPNVLFINENGVLTDRTSDFASNSDVPGDKGFLTPTNDRDVQLADLDNDGWLDIVTATTISVGDPKHIGHPRIYMNLGCGGDCNGTADWLGFRHEDARIPQLLTVGGQSDLNPCFCSVSVGDVTGDGYADLYFGDYDSGDSCAQDDFDDRLLVNSGAMDPGVFSDVTSGRFFGLVPGVQQAFNISAFGAANAIEDINGDSVNDIVKQTSLTAPTYVGTAFNDPFGEGFFDTYDNTYDLAPYFVTVGELNNDGKLDLVISDDGADRYLLNQGNGDDDVADFISYPYSFSHQGFGSPAADDGFAGNSVIDDLNNDGWNDVLITDVDVDVFGCGRRMHVYKNLGGTPGGLVTLQEQTSGSGCENLLGNPESCLVIGIPSNKFEGVHDVAVFDINDDGWQDMVVGRCSGTEVYINVPQTGPAGSVGDSAATQLRVDRNALDGQLELSWGASCNLEDNDYAIYRGSLAAPFDNHTEQACSTEGLRTRRFAPSPENSYYLVVPHNGTVEGSYGVSSDGTARQPGPSACRAHRTAACD